MIRGTPRFSNELAIGLKADMRINATNTQNMMSLISSKKRRKTRKNTANTMVLYESSIFVGTLFGSIPFLDLLYYFVQVIRTGYIKPGDTFVFAKPCHLALGICMLR